MSRKKEKTDQSLKWLPKSFDWMVLEFMDKTTTIPFRTFAGKGKTLDGLKNFSEKNLTIEYFYKEDKKWYPTTIIAHAGEIFSISKFLIIFLHSFIGVASYTHSRFGFPFIKISLGLSKS